MNIKYPKITLGVLNKYLLDNEIMLVVKNPEKLEIIEIYSAKPENTVPRLKEKLAEKEEKNGELRRLQVSLSKGDLKIIQAKQVL